ncbi:MAG TPA: Spy/CpxP family protein refolding chaperone [Verrucomicrobiae bacterium]|nr:Spy/CpxP family protein refolding chaperone [Verrucomicrobiae bacterium]
MTKGILTAGTLALVIAGSPPAFGHGMRGGGACGHGGLAGEHHILRALDLSADQRQQVKAILMAHRTTRAPLVANETAAKQALADKLHGTGTVAPVDLDALVEREAQAHTALVRERLATALDVRNVLTPAQIQKAATIRAGMKGLHAQMRQLLGKNGGE